jgi:3-oxoadipate enol-lactonase
MPIEYFEDGTDLRLAYRLTGSVELPVVIFVNALGTTMSIWDDVISAFDGNFQTLVYDQRGQGMSSVPSDNWGMVDHVRDLIALTENLGIESAALVGLSIGGQIAQGVAAERKKMVTQLVLINTGTKLGLSDHWNARADTVETVGMEGVLDIVLDRWFAKGFLDTDTKRARYGAMVLANNADGYAKSCRALGHTDLFDSTVRLSVQTLALGGSKDLATPPDMVRELSEIMQNCEFKLLKGAGHIACVDQPSLVADALLEFLSVEIPVSKDEPPRLR